MEDDLLYLYNQNLANEATDLFDQRQRDLVNQAAMNVFQTGFNNQNDGIMSTEQASRFPLYDDMAPIIDTSYGVANEPDELDEEETEQYEVDQFGYRKEPSGLAKIVDYLPFGEKSLGGALLRTFLPKSDPRATNIRNFYGQNYGLTDIGQVASGIMKGYNPVSGSDFLNKITGGLLPARSFGLADAARRRIERIANRKMAQTEASRAKIAALQKFAEKDTISRARFDNPNVYAKADKKGFTNSSGGFSTSAADKAGTSAGSGQGFSNKSGRGRTGY
jgi:hypothetical protein